MARRFGGGAGAKAEARVRKLRTWFVGASVAVVTVGGMAGAEPPALELIAPQVGQLS